VNAEEGMSVSLAGAKDQGQAFSELKRMGPFGGREVECLQGGVFVCDIVLGTRQGIGRKEEKRLFNFSWALPGRSRAVTEREGKTRRCLKKKKTTQKLLREMQIRGGVKKVDCRTA